MAVLSMKPYTLEYFHEDGGGYDEYGDWTPGESMWVEVGKCDAVPAGRNNIIKLPDGLFDTFSYTISNLPAGCRTFSAGERIRLKGLGMEVPLEVKGFARYQLQCKIWA